MSLLIGGHSWWLGRNTRDGGASSGKSAVQLLQESKSHYVKSDHVLEASQKPARPDRFHISSNPNIFLKAPAHTLHQSRLSPDPLRKSSNEEQEEPKKDHGDDNRENVEPKPVTVAALTTSSLAQHTIAMNKFGGGLPNLRIQKGTPRPRARTQPIGDQLNRSGDLRRSLSHGPADKEDDVQMKLRKLLDVGSKEKLFPESPTKASTHGIPTADEIINGTGTFRAEPVSVTVHKSLPDLWKTESIACMKKEEKRRPSCPGELSLDKQRKSEIKAEFYPNRKSSPPPVPPRKLKETARPLPQLPQTPPEVPRRLSFDPTPPRLPPRTNKVSSPPSCEDPKPVAQILPSVEHCRRNSDSDASATGGSEEFRRRPILRSKSDVTHERCLLGQQIDDDSLGSRTSLNREELELFFDSMGLDGSTFEDVINVVGDEEEALLSQYFEENSSADSIPRHCSSEEDGQAVNPDVAAVRPGEPSIIEKNARIIKWLFTCQRAFKGISSHRVVTLST